MKLNNKGYMLVEVIVASAIALVMAYFLVDITITLTNKNNDYYIESTLITDKNLITKEIMDDVNNPDYSLIGISVNIEGDVTTATLDYKKGDSTFDKKIMVDKSTNEIKYGEYTKKLDDILTIRDFKIEKDENQKQLYISIPAYTNYSDVDYGINLIIPYTIDIEVTIPEANLCDLTSGTPNSPDLVDGLIPVAYDESKNSWVKADSTNSNNSWYDYCEKKWANAVLVTDTNRNNYKNASSSTIILDSDILAFYVWIPRYKYKVWNINKKMRTASYDAYNKGIDIVFENDKESTGTISCTYNYNVVVSKGGVDLSTTSAETCTGSNGDYFTHPAFTFGDTELRGIWVNKFEISSNNPNATNGGGETTALTIRSLPNINSWRSNSISNYFTVIQNMQISNNIYGLNTSRTNIDSHMINNYEWGAIAYLTNSKYGRCTDGVCAKVLENTYTSDPNSSFGGNGDIKNMTGCGYNEDNFTSCGTNGILTCTVFAECLKYNTGDGMNSSTTGNISGVYDMSGNLEEVVMGNVSYSYEKFYFYSPLSGFSINWYTENNSKYLTTYANFPTSGKLFNQTGYNLSRLGDAVGESMLGGYLHDTCNTKIQPSDYVDELCEGTWYNGDAYFPRGPSDGYYGWMARTSMFGFDDAWKSGVTTRAVLVSLK